MKCMRPVVLLFVGILLCSLIAPVSASNRTIPVLLYHRLGGVHHPLYITPERFDAQIQTLKEHGFTSLSLQQYEAYILGTTTKLPEKPLLITFDDGDIDNYELASPILKRHGFKATFFIPTSFMDRQDCITTSQILEMHHAGMSFASHTYIITVWQI
jgi:peptidoglycan/xylan/chitin deacetylase (PgdA/CDA1 family)